MASTSTTQIPSSASTSTPILWDVFLSFRGKDTRTGFTSYLYDALNRNGIRTFMDDPELRSGEIISDALLEAIWNSKTYIVVLSKNYTSSRWCLDELVEILKCFKELGRLVIPVFYKVDPSVVGYQTKSFRKAFKKHEEVRIMGMDKLNKWRLALSQVANFSGLHVDGTRSEVDYISEVVDAVLREINCPTINAAKYPVGIDTPVAKITEWLTSGSPRGHYIGIWGMGGVGKTTLAKAVFNANFHSFEGSCFLADVGNVFSQRPQSLQEQLIADVLKIKKTEIDSVDRGIQLIRQRISSKKILIVVDDLNDQKQLDSLVVGPFAPVSVIILTTRHQDLLDRVEVEATYQYMLNELDDADSQELFNKHAFGDKDPSDTCLALSKEILYHAGGLPLALEIFGSALCNQPEAEWRRFVGELKEVVNPNIQKKLVISFESLEMGWEIARQSFGKDELRKHSRVSGWEDIFSVLDDNNGNKVTEAIKCMVHHYRYDDSCRVTFDTETFKRVPKLRFLKMKDVNLRGSIEQIFKYLTWLHWDYCPLKSLDSDFWPEKLVILQLPWSKITRWTLTKDLTNLKILDLSGSVELITTPDFSRLSCLETINLRSCTKLEKVDTTIGDLRNLVSLDLYDCTSLRRLPDSVCKLTALEILFIGNCYSLEALPEELGNIISLIWLEVGSPHISDLPDSTRRLTKLVHLRLDVQKLETLGDAICNFGSLEIIEISACRNLKELLPYDTSPLPDLQLPPNLRRLSAVGCSSILRLPALSNLKYLEQLNFKDCSSLREIRGLEEVILITTLILDGCESLSRLPNLSNLKQLKSLSFKDCSSLREIEGLEELTSIRFLDLTGCNSSVVANTLSQRLFQIYSQFGEKIEIHIGKGDAPDWSHSGFGCTEVWANVTHNFLGLLVSFDCTADFYDKHQGLDRFHICSYTINNKTTYWTISEEIVIVIVPGVDLIDSSCGVYNEETVFQVKSWSECDSDWHGGADILIRVNPLYKLPQRSNVSTLTKRKRVAIKE